MSKSSKYILAGGCSFTDKNFKSNIHTELDTSYPKWPELFGEYKNLPVENLGLCGAGNDYITNVVTRRILEDHRNIDTVVIGWTEIFRYSIYEKYRLNPIPTLYRPNRKSTVEEEAARPMFEYMFREHFINRHFSPNKPDNLFVWQVRSWANGMWQIQELCKTFGIKFIMGKLCGSISLGKFEQCEKSFKDKLTWTEVEWAITYSKIEELLKLDSQHYIGYPFLKGLGGYTFEHSLTGYELHPDDAHPNGEGHEFIAKEFYEQYAKVYS
tara:strand:+ start:50 stop:856 length:807 start_codon:yes stop_codon:yes gene_type:complete